MQRDNFFEDGLKENLDKTQYLVPGNETAKHLYLQVARWFDAGTEYIEPNHEDRAIANILKNALSAYDNLLLPEKSDDYRSRIIIKNKAIKSLLARIYDETGNALIRNYVKGHDVNDSINRLTSDLQIFLNGVWTVRNREKATSNSPHNNARTLTPSMLEALRVAAFLYSHIISQSPENKSVQRVSTGNVFASGAFDYAREDNNTLIAGSELAEQFYRYTLSLFGKKADESEAIQGNEPQLISQIVHDTLKANGLLKSSTGKSNGKMTWIHNVDETELRNKIFSGSNTLLLRKRHQVSEIANQLNGLLSGEWAAPGIGHITPLLLDAVRVLGVINDPSLKLVTSSTAAVIPAFGASSMPVTEKAADYNAAQFVDALIKEFKPTVLQKAKAACKKRLQNPAVIEGMQEEEKVENNVTRLRAMIGWLERPEGEHYSLVSLIGVSGFFNLSYEKLAEIMAEDEPVLSESEKNQRRKLFLEELRDNFKGLYGNQMVAAQDESTMRFSQEFVNRYVKAARKCLEVMVSEFGNNPVEFVDAAVKSSSRESLDYVLETVKEETRRLITVRNTSTNARELMDKLKNAGISFADIIDGAARTAPIHRPKGYEKASVKKLTKLFTCIKDDSKKLTRDCYQFFGYVINEMHEEIAQAFLRRQRSRAHEEASPLSAAVTTEVANDSVVSVTAPAVTEAKDWSLLHQEAAHYVHGHKTREPLFTINTTKAGIPSIVSVMDTTAPSTVVTPQIDFVSKPVERNFSTGPLSVKMTPSSKHSRMKTIDIMDVESLYRYAQDLPMPSYFDYNLVLSLGENVQRMTLQFTTVQDAEGFYKRLRNQATELDDEGKLDFPSLRRIIDDLRPVQAEHLHA